MVVLGLGCVVVAAGVWYVHWRPMTRIDGAHLLYLPVVLACLWFGWRGLMIAVLGGACLVVPHFIGVVPDASLEHDVLRTVVLIVVGAVISLLRQRQIATQRRVQRLQWQLEKSRETSAAEYEILSCRLNRQLGELRELTAAEQQGGAEKTSILDTVAESVVHLNAKHHVRWANRAACRRLDLTREAVVGRSWPELWTEVGVPGCHSPVLEAMETRRTAQGEQTTTDGRTWSVRGYALTDDKGEMIGGVEVALDVTAVKTTEGTLAQERRLLHTLVDSLPDSVYVKDREGRFVLSNEAVLRYLSVERFEDLEGKTDFDLFPEDVAAGFRAEECEVMESDRPMVGRERAQKDPKTGEPVWHSTTKWPWKNAAGEIVGVIGIGRDITDLKHTEEACDILVDNSLQGLVVLQDDRVVFANRAMVRITGHSLDEILSASAETVREFIHPDDRERVWGRHLARMEGRSVPDSYAFRAIRKDGSTCWVEIHASRTEYRGRPAIQGAFTDVTERVCAENALRESEAQNRALLDAIPDFIFQVSAEGVFLDHRNGERQGLHASAEELLGKNVADVLPEDVAGQFMQRLQQVVETGHTETFEYRLPVEGMDYDWECRLVRCGQRQVLAIVRDITERKRTESLRDLQRDVALELSSVSGLKDGYLGCLETALRSAQMDCGAIYTMDRETGGFQLVAHAGLSDEYAQSVRQIPRDSAVGRLALAGEPVFGHQGKLGVRLSPVQRREGLRALAIIPVKRKGRVIACLQVASHTLEMVPEWSRVILDMIATQISSTVVRLRAEEALRREHSLVSRITDTSPAGIMLVNRQGRVVFANTCAERILGLSREQIIGRQHNAPEWGIADYEGHPLPDEALPFARILASGKPVRDVRFSIERPDGMRVLLCVNAAPVLDEAGQIDGMVAAVDDVTENVMAERSLRESEERFRQIFENTMLGMYRTTPEGRVLMANPALVRMLGYSSFDELARRSVSGIYEQQESRDLFVQRMETNGQVVGLDAMWKRRDGTPLFVREYARVIRDASGETLYYEGTVEDITRRKEAEERLRYRLDFEELVATISNDFVNLGVDEIDEGIERTLGRLGTFVQADRSMVMLWEEGGMALVAAHEWHVPTVASTREQLLHDELKCLPWCVEQLERDGILDIPCVADLQGPASHAKQTLTSGGVTSFLAAPIMIDGELFGKLSLHAVEAGRTWSEDEITLIKIVAEVFANALGRQRSARALRERLAHETLLSDLSAVFVNLPVDRIDAEIQQGMSRIANALHIDRGAVLQLSDDDAVVHVTHAWAAEGLNHAALGPLESGFAWGLDCIRRGEIAVVSRIDEVADMGAEEKAYCQREGIKSGVLIPVAVAGETLGAVVFSAMRKERVWSSELVQRLRLVGEIFANALLRKRAEEALIASERNYREIFNAANDATFVHDPASGAIVDANNAALDMFGYSYEDILHVGAEALRCGAADQTREELRQLLVRATQEGPQVVEWLYRRNDGSRFYAEVDLKQASIGGRPRVLAVVRDITERKQAEKAAELHRAELARAWHVNTMGEMASGLAHELNQPLCAILNYANGCLRLTRKKELPKAALKESIKEVIGQAERAGDIIKRIRGLVGKREPRLAKLDVKALLSDAMGMIEKEAAKHDIAVVPEFGGRLPKVHADDVEIEQVALNLMRNAIEAMGDEKVAERTLTIATSRPEKGTIEVAIRDTGRGLSPELSERVFNSFFTTKQHGLGIGLSLSRRIVEAHGGKLWAESDGRSGTTFRFTLPVVGAPNAARRARSVRRR